LLYVSHGFQTFMQFGAPWLYISQNMWKFSSGYWSSFFKFYSYGFYFILVTIFIVLCNFILKYKSLSYVVQTLDMVKPCDYYHIARNSLQLEKALYK
jgi:hypothetical protein